MHFLEFFFPTHFIEPSLNPSFTKVLQFLQGFEVIHVLVHLASHYGMPGT
jgi:hypothetical protein